MNEVVAVTGGDNTSFTLGRDGTVMACGVNNFGQLGLGDTDNRDTFTMVPDLCGVVDIETGDNHAIAVTVEGHLYTWGTGWAIGHGGDDYTQCLVPTRVTGGGIEDTVVVQVAAGAHHTLALTASNELYAWGRGSSGQLGHGEKEHLAVPRVVDGIGAVAGMAGGGGHSLVITEEGRVLAFGCNGGNVYTGEEPVFVVDGRAGLGASVEEALMPTAIDGITMGEGWGGEGKEGKEGKE